MTRNPSRFRYLGFFIAALATVFLAAGCTGDTETEQKTAEVSDREAPSGAPSEDSHGGHALTEAETHDDHAGHGHGGEEGHDAHADAESDGAHAGHDHAEAEGHDDHAGHDHAHGAAGADLDREVDDLFNAECGHDMAAHQCAECRYEVGVVLLPEDLINDGLVRTTTVKETSFDGELELTGEIQFDERRVAHLGPRVSGVIRSVHVDLGQTVGADEVLIDLESIELAEAEADYLEARAEEELHRGAFRRQEELRRDGITSEREYLEAKQKLDAAAIRANSARLKIERLGLDAASISALEKAGAEGATGILKVRAPFAGEILRLHAVRGEQVDPESELVLVGDTRTLWVWVDIYESRLAAVSQGNGGGATPAHVSVPAYPGETFSGEIDFVGRVMDEATRTVKARVSLDNPQGKLRPGMFAKIHLELERGTPRLAVPEEAVLADEGREFVFIHHKDDYYVRRPIESGRRNAGYVEILAGLQPGQNIISTGSFLLKSDVLRSKMGEGCAH
ncbi:MAG: efflux RND transporter periplasmic adaptor subunit [Candidatus Eisenbacteria bacterium]|nr:efflux RND transporter periplasmic adaptor subunit [Candidatus Eisenbacteria bacterium]